MATVYKIHPAIGIARVGDSPDGFFVGPELLDGGPMELGADGLDAPFTTYKKDGLIKRQGARFRVFAYDEGGGGVLTNPREILPSGAVTLTWTVNLVNRKAAWTSAVDTDFAPRNPAFTGADRQKLIIAPKVQSISGNNQSGKLFDDGTFLNIKVPLGELRTDALGRLIVLGGHGKSASDKDDRPIGGKNFADNPFWYDDVSDGPVTAALKIDGVSQTLQGAWVIVAPPDFAPKAGGPVTIYDVAQHVAITKFNFPEPEPPSFRFDIQPILRRCASLRWTHGDVLWTKIPEDWKGLCNNTGPVADKLRKDTAKRLSGKLPLRLTGQPGVMLELTATQKGFLQAWADGGDKFVRDWETARAPSLANPADVDRGPLDSTVGGGFFPGIEAGNRITSEQLYGGPFRFRTDLLAGHITEQMALPWQSDFYQCEKNWWPSQRPDLAHLKQDLADTVEWTDGVIVISNGPGNEPERQMVKKFSKLGYIKAMTVSGKDVQVEEERIPPR